MKERQSFNPSEEYQNINILPTGPEKEKQKQEFHERRIRQKTEIATVAALIMEEVEANPDLDRDTLKETVQEHAPAMELSGPQQKLFNKMIDVYAKRREQIKELEKWSNDPREVFKKKFYHEPLGNVKVIFGPIVTHFILSDADYERIARESKNKNGVVLKSGGQFSSSREDVTISRSNMYSSLDNAVQKHEETHALKHMLDKVMGLERFDRTLKEKINHLKADLLAAKKPETKAYIAEKILQCYIDANGERIKDEIFANLRAGEEKSRNVVATLARSANHLGLYDYSEDDRRELTDFVDQNIGAADRMAVESVLKNFDILNRNSIREAVDSALYLAQEHGFTSEMIMVFLNDVPLSLWKKEVGRLKKSSK